MPRCSAAGRMDAALTSLRGPRLAAPAARDLLVREIGVFNTTTTAVCVGVKRFTAAGTAGNTITPVSWAGSSYTVVGVPTNTNAADNTAAGGGIVQATLGAAAGAGVIWTFGEAGLVIPAGTANGIFLYLPTGSSQTCDFYFIWDE